MKLKNLTKKLTTLAITALMATTLVSTQNVLAASKKVQKKANKAYAQAIKKNKVAKFTSYSLIEVTGGGTKELVTVNLNSNAEGKARNAYNKKQKTIAGLQYSVLSENGPEREKYYIYKYNGKKIVKKASYFFEREGHFEDEDGNKVTTNLEKSEKTVHRVIDKEIYSKKEKGKLTYISEKQYRSATKNDVRVWAYNNTTKKELIKKLRK